MSDVSKYSMSRMGPRHGNESSTRSETGAAALSLSLSAAAAPAAAAVTSASPPSASRRRFLVPAVVASANVYPMSIASAE
eukprot:35643-Chlamydomonas_euryale.AAC.1